MQLLAASQALCTPPGSAATAAEAVQHTQDHKVSVSSQSTIVGFCIFNSLWSVPLLQMYVQFMTGSRGAEVAMAVAM